MHKKEFALKFDNQVNPKVAEFVTQVLLNFCYINFVGYLRVTVFHPIYLVWNKYLKFLMIVELSSSKNNS